MMISVPIGDEPITDPLYAIWLDQLLTIDLPPHQRAARSNA